MRSLTPRRRAYSLLEMSCVMFLLAILLSITTVVLRTAIVMEQSQREGYDRILQLEALVDQFRADVSMAQTVPENLLELKNGPAVLILQMPDASHIVYAIQEGMLERRIIGQGDPYVQRFPVPGPDESIAFVREGKEPNLVRMRISTNHGAEAILWKSAEFAAAVGGARR